MRKIVCMSLTVIIAVAGVVLNILFGEQALTSTQIETLKVLSIICGASMLYCFVVGEITRNNSQMDKLWSILPIAYAWVAAGMGGMKPRLIIMAVLITAWGIRLTINFGRKGAYSIKFWSGEEDYRWIVLRKNKFLNGKFRWALFDLFFISIYQNALVLAICLPMVAVQEVNAPLNIVDIIGMVAVGGFILLETVADEQQMKFQTTKYKMLGEGKKLEELPNPYRRGFNTTGVWAYAAHPNYFSEQAIWVSLYIFVIAAGVANNYVFNWSMIGCLVLILLFLGSAEFGESVSSSKYPEYKRYLSKVTRFIPLIKYNPIDNE
ncbi:MAG: DUF1295 domain-containing protein [Bacilli bacterium]|nr:DUF1295 domain-containing protein [Bacilli bacterium]